MSGVEQRIVDGGSPVEEVLMQRRVSFWCGGK